MISVINRSYRISGDDIAKIVFAIGKQLAVDVAPIYGITPVLEFGVPDSTGTPCFIEDVPDVDGALGYHDEGSDGISFIKVFCNPTLDNGGTIMTGSNSVSMTLSHEILELIGDNSANVWADGPNGYDYAYELCDAVEGDSYVIDGVSVSNFVYPAFFDPRASSNKRLDRQSLLSKPFTMTPGGYQIRRAEPGRVDEIYAHRVSSAVHMIFGEAFPDWKKPYKARKAHKRAKRGV